MNGEKDHLMLSHEEMIGLQAEKHELTNEDEFETADQYVLHLMHCAAYLHASRVVDGRSVLDLGCNSGYGTKILSSHAEFAVGVDVSERAIALAQKKYTIPNIAFQVIDGVRLPFEDKSFEVATCFQIIEHLVEYSSFMSEVVRVLRPDGIAIFTTPNSLLRLDPGMKPWNPFHIREFNAEELRATLEAHFKHVAILALYARDPVHQMVVDRADRIRRSARAKTSAGSAPTRPRSLRAWVKAVLPTALVTNISNRTPQNQSSPLEYVRHNHSPEDFHYQTGGLTASLEFMAICSAEDIAPYVESLTDRHT
jgi:2-polyprenyl-3-methyl-5-hydroxy-6-metoxy-1,4-benzoquinol methylase